MTGDLPGDALSSRRLDDLERATEDVKDRNHRLANRLTEIHMKTDLLELDHEHLKRDFWHRVKESKARDEVRAIADADAALAQSRQRLSLEELRGRQESTERILKWVLGVVSTVGAGATVAFLANVVKT